jgi:predicted nucleic acid-binding protein
MTGYMLDTNFFNRVVAGEIAVDLIARYAVFATHVQRDELGRTRDDAKRAQLLAAFDAVGPGMKPTSTAVFDDSKWDECQWSADDGVYEAMLARLEALDRASDKPWKEFNQSRDIRIAETAIKNGLMLVTNDANLATVMLEFGGNTITAEQFKKERPASGAP